MMNNLSERDRKTLKLGGYGVGAIVLFALVISPVMDQWKEVDGQIAKTRQNLRGIQDNIEGAASASQRLKELQQLAWVHGDPVSLNQQTAQMLHQVESLEGYKGIQVQRLEGMPVREEDRFYRSAVSLQFAGTLGNLHRFLQDVEKAKPGLKVERLTLSSNSKEPGRLDGQMVISGYAVVLQKRKNG